MPYKEFINGHGSTYGIWKYLMYDKETGEKRSIYSKTYNLFDDKNAGFGPDRPWYKIMDEEREMMGTNTPNHGRKALTFKHYVIAPDPRDDITPEELSEFIDEWLERGFHTHEYAGGKFGVAVEMHDDNGKLHAHIVFNNVNYEREWEDGNRIAQYLTKSNLKYVHDLIEEMAADRGWHNFLDKEKNDLQKQDEQHMEYKNVERMLGIELKESKDLSSENEKLLDQKHQFFKDNYECNPYEEYKRPIEIASNGKLKVTRKGSYIDTKEAEIIRREGTSNKEDIRKIVDLACLLAYDQHSFKTILNCFDIELKRNKRGDFVYTHPIDKKRQFTGYRLGSNYTYKTVMQRISKNAKLDKKGELDKEGIGIRKNYLGKLAGIGVQSVYRLDTPLTTSDLAKMTEINDKYNIWTVDDYNTKLAELDENDIEAKKELEWARNKNTFIHNSRPLRTHKEKIDKILSDKPVREMTDQELIQLAQDVYNRGGYADPKNRGGGKRNNSSQNQQQTQKQNSRNITNTYTQNKSRNRGR